LQLLSNFLAERLPVFVKEFQAQVYPSDYTSYYSEIENEVISLQNVLSVSKRVGIVHPKYIQVEPKQVTAAKIDHYLLPARHRNKLELTFQALETFNPYLAIVFTNTKKKADEVADRLMGKGLKVGRIHGGLSPRERKQMMKQILDLDYQYIVATDLAARGIDIQGISHVINYELPSDLDFYIHRVGRTARAGYSGIALTIYEDRDEDALNKLENKGIEFRHCDLHDHEWVDLGDRNKRNKRKRQVNQIDLKAKSIIKKPKKFL